ncbi:DUF817 domain-containing protein [Longirhabdus pacifica]|uniref:DUF817 domain-containing protein n=1 Tax=Longirhabdus pacifica TaxID=2305227 RepID=UPI001F0C1F6A|nr:DUF817 domain-containing protein [Longirhabdus pacifica]
MKKYIHHLFWFGYHQALSCIFPVIIFITLAVSHVVNSSYLFRYDFILVICIVTQVIMVWSKLETIDELKVISVFHVIGFLLEVYKVHMGSWSYPEEAWSKVFGVPLYSGFMYASVASYLCQAWRRLQVQLIQWPSNKVVIPLGAMIYINFFSHHYIPDFRWWLTLCLLIVFFRSSVTFQIQNSVYRMHILLSFLLIGFFIWIAENISTFFGAWSYPNQEQTWDIVHVSKISSWFLLIVVSFMIVAQLKIKKNKNILYLKKDKPTVYRS